MSGDERNPYMLSSDRMPQQRIPRAAEERQENQQGDLDFSLPEFERFLWEYRNIYREI